MKNLNMKSLPRMVASCLLLSGILSFEARANLISNGGFEAGLADWTVVDQTGSDGSFFPQTGISSPVSSFPVPLPPEGATAAMTDSQGPGAHVLYQTFIPMIPMSSVHLSFEMFIGNYAEAFFVPDTLDFATPALNQQIRVDILRGGVDPFSISAADLLLNVFLISPTDPLISGYTHHSIDISSIFNANLNQPLMLRFAETDNVANMQLGIDNVSIEATAVPDSSPGGMAVLTLLGLICLERWSSARLRQQGSGNP